MSEIFVHVLEYIALYYYSFLLPTEASAPTVLLFYRKCCHHVVGTIVFPS